MRTGSGVCSSGSPTICPSGVPELLEADHGLASGARAGVGEDLEGPAR